MTQTEKSSSGPLINFNEASLDEFMTVQGIGQNKAQHIIEIREQVDHRFDKNGFMGWPAFQLSEDIRQRVSEAFLFDGSISMKTNSGFASYCHALHVSDEHWRQAMSQQYSTTMKNFRREFEGERLKLVEYMKEDRVSLKNEMMRQLTEERQMMRAQNTSLIRSLEESMRTHIKETETLTGRRINESEDITERRMNQIEEISKKRIKESETLIKSNMDEVFSLSEDRSRESNERQKAVMEYMEASFTTQGGKISELLSNTVALTSNVTEVLRANYRPPPQENVVKPSSQHTDELKRVGEQINRLEGEMTQKTARHHEAVKVLHEKLVRNDEKLKSLAQNDDFMTKVETEQEDFELKRDLDLLQEKFNTIMEKMEIEHRRLEVSAEEIDRFIRTEHQVEKRIISIQAPVSGVTPLNGNGDVVDGKYNRSDERNPSRRSPYEQNVRNSDYDHQRQSHGDRSESDRNRESRDYHQGSDRRNNRESTERDEYRGDYGHNRNNSRERDTHRDRDDRRREDSRDRGNSNRESGERRSLDRDRGNSNRDSSERRSRTRERSDSDASHDRRDHRQTNSDRDLNENRSRRGSSRPPHHDDDDDDQTHRSRGPYERVPNSNKLTFNGEHYRGFMEKFMNLAEKYNWDEQKKKDDLVSRLEGKAMEYFVYFKPEEKKSFKLIKEKLERRYDKHQNPAIVRAQLANLRQGVEQDLRDFAEEVLRSVAIAYPDNPEMQDTHAIEYMAKGCRNSSAAALVLTMKPSSFENAVEALENAIENELFVQQNSKKVRICGIDNDDSNSAANEEMNKKISEVNDAVVLLTETVTKRFDKSPEPKLCHICKEPGHFKANCPKRKSPRYTPDRSRGNYGNYAPRPSIPPYGYSAAAYQPPAPYQPPSYQPPAPFTPRGTHYFRKSPGRLYYESQMYPAVPNQPSIPYPAPSYTSQPVYLPPQQHYPPPPPQRQPYDAPQLQQVPVEHQFNIYPQSGHFAQPVANQYQPQPVQQCTQNSSSENMKPATPKTANGTANNSNLTRSAGNTPNKVSFNAEKNLKG